ncbi:MAG: ABC transporter substrate-binding protein [Chloroflexi bacterium]|nr:MAG: ABC transporter substrate-binding protein [Chloroflexota bacterium]
MSVAKRFLSIRFFSLTIALLSLATVSTTCIAIATPTPTPVPPAPTQPPPTVMPSPTSMPGSPTATPQPQVLRFGVPADPVRLDPALSLDPVSDLVSAQLYDTLVHFAPGTTRIEPALATEWSVSLDGLTWEFVLRKGVAFHDGTPLTAQAVVWNFQRWMDPNHPAHNGDFRYWQGMFGGFVGEENSDDLSSNLVASVTAPDDHTLRIVLNKPFAPLLHNLAMNAFAILNPDIVMSRGPDAYGTATGPRATGTGPFRLVSWEDGQVTLVANPDYWAGPPALSRLIFQTIPDDSARFSALQAGEIDGMISPAVDDLARADQDPRLQVVMDPRPTTAFLNFNLDGEYLGKREVRQAIAHAINKTALVRDAFGPTWQVATQMLPPAIWGYNENIEDYPYDPGRARELLAAAGVPEQLEIDLWYPDRPRPYLPNPRAAAEAIAADLEAVGMSVTLQTEHWSAYLADRSNGAFSMWLLGWTGYNGDPDSFFFYHFGLPTPREGNYVNRDLRDLLLRGQVIVDPEMREEIYQEAAAMIHKDVPRLFLAHPQEPVLLSSQVEGFTPNPAGPEAFVNVSLQK